MILRLRYVQKFKDRHGRVRFYLRRKGCKPIPLPHEDDPGFRAAHEAAMLASAPVAPANRVPDGSLEALARLYYSGPKFRQLNVSTQSVYRRIITDLCRQHGAKPVYLLQTAHIQKLIDEKMETPAAGNHVLRTLRSLMKHAVKLKWRPDDPTQGVERLKEVGAGVETWSEEDIAAFEARWPIGTKPRLALGLLIYTGQRRSDVVRMGRQHVRDGVIEVRQLKTKARLFIPLHPELATMIASETNRLTFLMTDTAVPKPYTANGFYMRFREWVEAAGLPAGRSPHGLRKAAARRMAEAGCSAHVIASVTGHKTLSEVQRYTRAADQAKMAREAVAHLGRPQIENNGVKLYQPKVSNRK